MKWSTPVLQFAKAIAVAENSPVAWNNPGSLTGTDAGSFATCGFGNAEGVWKFVNAEDGWNALYIKVDRIFRGKSTIYPLSMTVEQFGLRYSGGDPNEGKNIASYLGIDPASTLQEYLTHTGGIDAT